MKLNELLSKYNLRLSVTSNRNQWFVTMRHIQTETAPQVWLYLSGVGDTLVSATNCLCSNISERRLRHPENMKIFNAEKEMIEL